MKLPETIEDCVKELKRANEALRHATYKLNTADLAEEDTDSAEALRKKISGNK